MALTSGLAYDLLKTEEDGLKTKTSTDQVLSILSIDSLNSLNSSQNRLLLDIDRH